MPALVAGAGPVGDLVPAESRRDQGARPRAGTCRPGRRRQDGGPGRRPAACPARRSGRRRSRAAAPSASTASRVRRQSSSALADRPVDEVEVEGLEAGLVRQPDRARDVARAGGRARAPPAHAASSTARPSDTRLTPAAAQAANDDAVAVPRGCTRPSPRSPALGPPRRAGSTTARRALVRACRRRRTHSWRAADDAPHRARVGRPRCRHR